jgi:hypothetical protein
MGSLWRHVAQPKRESLKVNTHPHFLEIYEAILDSVLPGLHQKHTSILFLNERIDTTILQILRAGQKLSRFHSSLKRQKDCLCNYKEKERINSFIDD